MRSHSHRRVSLLRAACGLLLVLSLSCASAALAQPHLHGLNPRELSTRANCSSQPRGYARCASERLVYVAGETPVRSVSEADASATAGPAITPAGYGPSELQSAYKLTTLAANQGADETIAVVDAYDDPNAEADLAVYRSHYGLPPCAAGCFTKIEQAGTQASPKGENDWSLEISLDLDMASAICPKCHLLLMEANGNGLGALAKAAHTAATTTGVVAVSNSYAANEDEVLPKLSFPERAAYERDYTQPGVAFTAAAGDAGYEVNIPAALSTVTAVGGTSLQPSGSTWSETAWSLSCKGSGSSRKCTGTGGGCSEYVAKPAWQVALGSADAGCANRTENDISADANPNTGAAVYNTDNENGGWEVVGGTSESSPIAAGFYALIGQQAGVEGASWDYAHTGFFKDVSGGENRAGCLTYLCEALVGYDGPTGLGSPNGSGEEPPAAEENPAGKGSNEGESGGVPETLANSGGGTAQPVAGLSGKPEGEAAGGSTTPDLTPTLVPVLSALALTKTATAALRHDGKPKVAQVAFTFTLSLATHVRVTLAKQVKIRGQKRWQTLPYSLTIAAAKGRDSARLSAHGTLAPGRYRLTLAPVHGTARTLVFQIG